MFFKEISALFRGGVIEINKKGHLIAQMSSIF